jgi:hypothetical protein
MATETQQIFYAFAGRQFDELEKLINNLQQHPNNIIVKQNYGSNGYPTIRLGYSLFTTIAYGVYSIQQVSPYHKWDDIYEQLCRILRTLKNKGADLEMERQRGYNGSYGPHTRVLCECVTGTYNNCPHKFIKFLLELGANPNNYECNELIEYTITFGHANFDLMIILLEHGTDINKQCRSKGVSPKNVFYSKFQNQIDLYIKSGYQYKYKEGTGPYVEMMRILKMKELFDRGADVVLNDIRNKRNLAIQDRLEQEEKERQRQLELKKQQEEAQRKQLELQRQQKAEQQRLQRETEQKRLQQEAEQKRLQQEAEQQRLQQEAERQKQLALQKQQEEKDKIETEQNEDEAYLTIALENSVKCKEVHQYLSNDFITYYIDFITTLLKMVHSEDHTEIETIKKNIDEITKNSKNNNILFDKVGRDKMGGSCFIFAIINIRNMHLYEGKIPEDLFKYLNSFVSTLLHMANDNMHDKTKQRIISELSPELKGHLHLGRTGTCT